MNLAVTLEQKLGRELVQFLKNIGQQVERCGGESYLVGGLVRDLLIEGHPCFPDIDIMTTIDAGDFARTAQREWLEWFPGFPQPHRPVVYKRYRTAKLSFDLPLFSVIDRIDFATARKEVYPVSGGVPELSEGDLASDLARRDFSMNAVAVQLAEKTFGEVCDHYQGLLAIKAREIAVLHERSFIDDPARLLRALRFMARFGFSMESQTTKLFEESVRGRFLLRLPRRRLRDELRKTFEEPDIERVVRVMHQQGLLSSLAGHMQLVEAVAAHVSVVDKLAATSDRWLAYFSICFLALGQAEFQALLENLEFSAAEQQICKNHYQESLSIRAS